VLPFVVFTFRPLSVPVALAASLQYLQGSLGVEDGFFKGVVRSKSISFTNHLLQVSIRALTYTSPCFFIPCNQQVKIRQHR